MLIMVCNIGSTNFKFQLLDMTTENQPASGYTERVGTANAIMTYSTGNKKTLEEISAIPTHREAVKHALHFFSNHSDSPLSSLDKFDGIGFKTIQAGDENGSVLLDEEVLQAMEDYRSLTPAHNPL